MLRVHRVGMVQTEDHASKVEAALYVVRQPNVMLGVNAISRSGKIPDHLSAVGDLQSSQARANRFVDELDLSRWPMPVQ